MKWQKQAVLTCRCIRLTDLQMLTELCFIMDCSPDFSFFASANRLQPICKRKQQRTAVTANLGERQLRFVTSAGGKLPQGAPKPLSLPSSCIIL